MKIFSKALIVALLAGAFSTTLSARNVIIANGCEGPLAFIGLSRASDTEVENLLDETLAPGDGIEVDLLETRVDLTARDTEGNQVDFSGLDLSKASKVILRSDGSAEIE